MKMELKKSIFLLLTSMSIAVSAGTPVEEVRLVGGGRSDQGRVEVKMGGQWGTVCDDDWDHRDARVVCRMLQQTGGVAFSNAYFGQGMGSMLLDSVGCVGDEDNLNMCPVGLPDVTSPSVCTHVEDAGVRCGVEPSASGPSLSGSPVRLSPLSSNCADGRNTEANVRLVGTDRLSSSGFVQVRDPSKGFRDFGFVCDDSWNLLNARVVCKELCFDPADALPGWRKPTTVQLPASPKILLDDVRCLGTEPSLLLCQHQPWNFHDCSFSELAAVTCASVAANPQVPQAEVECQEDQMVVTFQRRLNPTLQKESLVPAPSMPSTCQPKVWADGARIVVTLDYQQCSTLIQNESPSGNLTFVSSLLVLLEVDPSPRYGMKRVTEYKIQVQCNVAGSYSASRRLPHVGQPVLPASGDTRLSVTMIMYQDETFTKPVAAPNVVLAPGGWINLGLTLNTNQRIKLVVTSCFAGPDLNDPTKPKQALLLDKCVQEETVSTYTINDTFWGLRFQPFSFNNFSDVTIDCEAYACKTDMGSCDQSCNAAMNKYNTISRKSRRRRRAQLLLPYQGDYLNTSTPQQMPQAIFSHSKPPEAKASRPVLNNLVNMLSYAKPGATSPGKEGFQPKTHTKKKPEVGQLESVVEDHGGGKIPNSQIACMQNAGSLTQTTLMTQIQGETNDQSRGELGHSEHADMQISGYLVQSKSSTEVQKQRKDQSEEKLQFNQIDYAQTESKLNHLDLSKMGERKDQRDQESDLGNQITNMQKNSGVIQSKVMTEEQAEQKDQPESVMPRHQGSDMQKKNKPDQSKSVMQGEEAPTFQSKTRILTYQGIKLLNKIKLNHLKATLFGHEGQTSQPEEILNIQDRELQKKNKLTKSKSLLGKHEITQSENDMISTKTSIPNKNMLNQSESTIQEPLGAKKQSENMETSHPESRTHKKNKLNQSKPAIKLQETDHPGGGIRSHHISKMEIESQLSQSQLSSQKQARSKGEGRNQASSSTSQIPHKVLLSAKLTVSFAKQAPNRQPQ